MGHSGDGKHLDRHFVFALSSASVSVIVAHMAGAADRILQALLQILAQQSSMPVHVGLLGIDQQNISLNLAQVATQQQPQRRQQQKQQAAQAGVVTQKFIAESLNAGMMLGALTQKPGMRPPGGIPPVNMLRASRC